MKSDRWVLGISASHNGAVCLLYGDEIVVAVQEERLTRHKRRSIYGARPSLALDYCLEYAGITPRDLSLVVITALPTAKAEVQDLTANPTLQVAQNKTPVLTISHHLAHAVSAFATSGYQESAVLIVDGRGSRFDELSEQEYQAIKNKVVDGWESISLYTASGASIMPLEKHLVEVGAWIGRETKRMPKFGTLGGMFSAAALQIFGDIHEAGKVMGLAPYGRLKIPVREFFKIADGQFIFTSEVSKRFRYGERWPSHKEEYQDLARSTQAALEEALIYLVGQLRKLCPSRNLCYAGGVALNSVANERIIRESGFENIYIMPAAEDSGTAIGAAYYGMWSLNGHNTRRRLIHDSLGKKYSQAAISDIIQKASSIQLVGSSDIISQTVDLLSDGKIIGWFQGGSELGPRALGQRSILCDPRREDGKEVLNQKVKHREAFRPFAPAVLLEEVDNWFDLNGTGAESPFMLRVCNFKEEKRRLVPAVVHVDGTGRVQTLTRDANGRFYDLVNAFYERTGVPMILNTSFNIMGEPIIETPQDALWCLLYTGLDYCVLEDSLVTKKESYTSKILSDFSSRIRKIRRSAKGLRSRADLSDPKQLIAEIVEQIHLLSLSYIPKFQKEVTDKLGYVPPVFSQEYVVTYWKVALSGQSWEAPEVWEGLDRGTQAHLTTGGLLFTFFSMQPSPYNNLTSIIIEFCKAIEVELNQKLIVPFLRWLRAERPDDMQSLLSSITEEERKDGWFQIICQSAASSTVACRSQLPLETIGWALYNLAGYNTQGGVKPAEQRLLSLIRRYLDRLGNRQKGDFFELLPRTLSHLITIRNNSLQTDNSSREETPGLSGGVQRLLIELIRKLLISTSRMG
jgi:carbamoyltransferase